ncbi:DNA polymerase IV [Desertimonas flava]|uniref:DNA polymerase IV n=1 Tax=Desertimonas flava TaxID=2064846 RepID=UPI001D0C2509|nr:DNA polymerase IV [Desertimonas flava]
MIGRRGEEAGATILHADLDAFFAAVEQRDDASLRGRPIAVGGIGGVGSPARGVVMCPSYEARAYGVRGAMGAAEARRRCPDLVFVPPRLDAYTEASRAVFAVFDDTTPFVEGISVDEAFLDVGGLRRVSGAPVDIARRLRQDVRERVGLPISVGVARTKFLAKMASAAGKPDGLLHVPPTEELAFLHPMPIERVWGIGAKTADLLHARGISRVADIAALPEAALVAILGPHRGRHVHALASNRDPRPVRAARRRRTIGSQRAIGRGATSSAELDTMLVAIVDRVARRLRSADRVGRTVILRLRFDDFSRATRSHSLDRATDDSATFLAVARRLLAGAAPMIEERGVTLVGLTIANLDDDDAVQLTLPFHADQTPERESVDRVLDDVRDRFGSTALTRAVLLGRDEGFSVPQLPD